MFRFDKKNIDKHNQNIKDPKRPLIEFANDLAKDDRFIHIIVSRISSGEYGMFFTYNLDNSEYYVPSDSSHEVMVEKKSNFSNLYDDKLFRNFGVGYKGSSLTWTNGSSIVKG